MSKDQEKYEKFLDKLANVEVYEDDVWLVTLPKSGTTWMQELLWLVINDFDFETAKLEHLEIRTPFMEFDYFIHQDLERALKPIEQLKRPRLIKTHLDWTQLPVQIKQKKPKLVYVARNPKNALVSRYYHLRSTGHIDNISLEQFIDDCIHDESTLELFKNMTDFYGLRSEPWVFYTSYERMKLNLSQIITDVCKFLNKTIDESAMHEMLHHLSFEEMKKNPKTNHNWEFEQLRKLAPYPYVDVNFCRKGQMNGYKEELSPDMAKKLDEWVDENVSKYNLTMGDLLLLN